MDDELYLPGLTFIALGIAGVWLTDFSGIAETFEGARGIAILVLVLGLILVPASFLRGGSASPKHIISTVLVIGFGIGALGVPYYLSVAQPPQPEVITGREVSIFLVANEWAFNATNPTITVTQGDKVQVTVFNEGTVAHNFGVIELTRTETKLIPPADSDTITFVAAKAGRFEYVCPVPGHKELGMRGEFIVEAP